MRKLTLATVLLTGMVVWAQDQRPDQNSASDGANTTAASAPADQKISVTMSTVSPEPVYVIGIDDVLRIAVWKEPDLTNTLPVRSDGMISMPLLNDVQAAGLTPMQLAALLTQKLRKYVAVPNVTVVVTQTNSHRIYVIGEVLHTGPISLLHNMTVLQALATAGFTQFANTKGIYVLREENGQGKKIPFNYKRVVKGGGAADQNIVLQPGDTIVVP
jgi:polysaccharide export outer membrane protein